MFRPFARRSTPKPARTARRHRKGLRGESLENRLVMASWLGQIGGGGDETVSRSDIMDASGNIYVGGMFNQVADFDPGSGATTLSSAGQYDACVAKYSSSGSLIWARRFGGSTRDETYGLTLDATEGGLYVTGVFQGSADFTGDNQPDLTSAGLSDVFILKLNPADGGTVWQQRVGGSGEDHGRDIAAADGQVYVAGYFSNTVDFNPGAGVNSLTPAGKGKFRPADGFVLKLAENGDYVSAWNVGGGGYDIIQNMTVEGGAIHVVGTFTGAADFDPTAGVTTLQSGSSTATFFASYTTAGGFNWARGISGTTNVTEFRLEADASSLYLSGPLSGTADFDPGTATFNLTSAGGSDAAVAKFSKTDGSLVWARRFGGTGIDQAFKSFVNSTDGSVYVGGYFEGAVDFNGPALGGVLTAAGIYDGLLLKLDAFGNYLNAWQAGDFLKIVSVVDGTIYATGWFNGTAAFPTGGTLTCLAGNDAYLMAFDEPPSALLAAATPTTAVNQTLTTTEFQPLVAEALRRWASAGVDTSSLGSVNVQVANLGGRTLGLASGNSIWLDDNGAGWGWFVDPTPGDDSEFMLPGNQGERNRMDLLSVVMHEVGHLLGQDHDQDGVMAETLAAGVRETGLHDDHGAVVDQVFSSWGSRSSDAWLSAWWSAQVESEQNPHRDLRAKLASGKAR